MRGFRETIERDTERAAVVARLPVETRLGLYAGLLRARLHDIQLKRWVRTGVISKAWLGTGEEATTVGPVHALERGRDVVAPMIRNMVPVTAGIALTFKIRQEPRVVLTWVGDGSTKTAAAHEGTNFAAVQKLPAIFIIQNNQVALGTRLEQHHLPGNFDEWAASYGIVGAEFDGNNVLDAYAATKLAADRCRRGEGPALLVAETFRMGGHATHDEREARDTFPAALFEQWGKRDPIGMYEEYLKADGITVKRLGDIEAEVIEEVERSAEQALQSRDRMPPGESALQGVYAKHGT